MATKRLSSPREHGSPVHGLNWSAPKLFCCPIILLALVFGLSSLIWGYEPTLKVTEKFSTESYYEARTQINQVWLPNPLPPPSPSPPLHFSAPPRSTLTINSCGTSIRSRFAPVLSPPLPSPPPSTMSTISSTTTSVASSLLGMSLGTT